MSEETILYVVISEYHGDFDKSSIVGIFDNEDRAKLITKLAYLNELSKHNIYGHNQFNENTSEGIFYDEDDDIYRFKYERHYLNANLLIN